MEGRKLAGDASEKEWARTMEAMVLSGSLPTWIDWHWVWLTVAAFLAGLLNAVAGGGSFMLFPAILGMGIPPIEANATNTVALWPGQFTSIAAYWAEIRQQWSMALMMGLSGFIGGTGGAIVLLLTPQMTFLHLVPWLLLTAATIFAASGPISRWLEARSSRVGEREPRRVAIFVTTLILSFYVGYFGAGTGFLIITELSLFGYQNLHKINALKVFTTTIGNGVAFLIFVVSGKVVWHYCLLAMLASGAGGYLSARTAKRIPQPILRNSVVALGLGMAAWFFWRNHGI